MTREDISKSSWKKWIAGTLLVFVLILLVGIITINVAIEPYIEEQVTAAFSDFSNDDAVLQISDLDLGIFPVSITLQDIRLEKGPNATERLTDHPVLQSSIGYVSVSGISLYKYLTDGDISIGDVSISESDIHVSPGLTERYKTSSDESGRSTTVTVERVNLSGSDIDIYSKDLSEVITTISGISVQLMGLDLSGDGGDSTRIINQITFNVDTVSHKTESGHYTATASNISFDSEEGVFSTDEFHFIPALSPKELPRVVGHEVDHLDISLGPISLSGLNGDLLLSEGKIEASHVSVTEPRVNISRDKNPPDKVKNPRPLMNTAFANLTTSVSIDSFLINRGYISYREWQVGQDTSGTVFFDSIDVKIRNLQNVNHDERITADVRTSFMNLADLTVSFDFSLLEDGSQTISGRMGGLDLESLNEMLVPLAFVRVDRGTIHSVDFDFKLNNQTSSGEFITLYENFSMSLLSKDGLDSSTGKRIISFLANNIQIHSSNTGPDPRVGDIRYEKEVGQSTVNYWWKSIRSGMKDLVQRI